VPEATETLWNVGKHSEKPNAYFSRVVCCNPLFLAVLKCVCPGVRAPNQKGAERFVLSVKRECLDFFVVFGEAHLRHILSEYLTYYHQVRPHKGLDNRPLGRTELTVAETDQPLGEVVCHERLGGLLRHYQRRAA
jgi:putative transposase